MRERVSGSFRLDPPGCHWIPRLVEGGPLQTLPRRAPLPPPGLPLLACASVPSLAHCCPWARFPPHPPLSPGGLSLAIEGPSKAEISCTDNQDGTCSVSYLPVLPGDYSILVKYNEQHIPGSPFTARVTGRWYLERCQKEAGGRRQGGRGRPLGLDTQARPLPPGDDSMRMSHLKVGSAADIPINISETDLSLLTATVVPPSGREEPCLLKRLRNGHVGKELGRKAFWKGGRLEGRVAPFPG